GVLADAKVAQPVEVVRDICGDKQPVTTAETCDPLASPTELPGPLLQGAVDFGDRRREPVGPGGEQLLDAGKRHAGLGERFDLDQVDGVLGGIPPVARRVTRRLLEQTALVVVAYGLDGHAGVRGELADRDHLLRITSPCTPAERRLGPYIRRQ